MGRLAARQARQATRSRALGEDTLAAVGSWQRRRVPSAACGATGTTGAGEPKDIISSGSRRRGLEAGGVLGKVSSGVGFSGLPFTRTAGAHFLHFTACPTHFEENTERRPTLWASGPHRCSIGSTPAIAECLKKYPFEIAYQIPFHEVARILSTVSQDDAPYRVPVLGCGIQPRSR